MVLAMCQGAFATLPVADGLSAWDAEGRQIPDSRADEPPAFPEAHAQSAANPLIEVIEQFQLARQREVARPAWQETSQFRESMVHRDPSTAASQFANAMFEALDVLLRHVDRRSRATKDEAEKFDSITGHDPALLQVHHQAKNFRQITSHPGEYPLGTPLRPREDRRLSSNRQTADFAG
jgi:hypothetical protein